MRAYAKIALVAIAVALMPLQSSHAVTIGVKIRALKECPDGLTINSKVNDGMIEFDISVDAEKIAQPGDLYKGRVGSRASLKVATSEQQIASVAVQGTTKGQRTHYQFRLSPLAVQTSELSLRVHIYEKNGAEPIGGAVLMQIHLAGFEPKTDKSDGSTAVEARPRTSATNHCRSPGPYSVPSPRLSCALPFVSLASTP